MKKTLLALAIASMSLAALADAPTTKPPIGPINVSVVSPVPLPVTEVPSWTTVDRLFFTGSSGGTVGTIEAFIYLDTDVVLQALDMQVHLSEDSDGTDATCYADAIIEDGEGTEVARLGRVTALGGRDAALSIQLPSVYVDADQDYRVHLTVTGPAAIHLCFHEFELRGVKLP